MSALARLLGRERAPSSADLSPGCQWGIEPCKCGHLCAQHDVLRDGTGNYGRGLGSCEVYEHVTSRGHEITIRCDCVAFAPVVPRTIALAAPKEVTP
jgi:hypothetical protein